ncbi:hypothetical protein E4U21_004746 [Claviceps maximensis]|nr:hypothetical protein E4U21_004746 [Claviceps maximensis]
MRFITITALFFAAIATAAPSQEPRGTSSLCQFLCGPECKAKTNDVTNCALACNASCGFHPLPNDEGAVHA